MNTAVLGPLIEFLHDEMHALDLRLNDLAHKSVSAEIVGNVAKHGVVAGEYRGTRYARDRLHDALKRIKDGG